MTEAEGPGERRPLVQIVPNFSEGRRQDVMDAIVAALQVPGVALVNRQSDPDHNRLDCTLIGGPEAVRRSALAGAAKAVELIDMEEQRGSHPRMGAVDVIPFVPVRDISMEECVELARTSAREIAEALDLPVYCYDQAALSPDRRSLADVRRGEYEGLRADVEAGVRLPDFGPHRLGKAGAVAVGARKALIAFNVYFAGDDETAVKAVARRVRESTGGLTNVRAIGFGVPERGMVEVSMNLVDHEATPMYRALELVRLEAARHGLVVRETEIVGLVPQAAVAETAAHYLQLAGFDPREQILENLVTRAPEAAGVAAGPVDDVASDEGPEPAPASFGEYRLAGFLDALASADPTPGGGSAASVTAAMGAALVGMVARVTMGKKAFEAVRGRMEAIAAQADQARAEFLALSDRDAVSFDAVMAAYRLPKVTEDEQAARAEAIERALAGASDVPMDVARRAVAVMELAQEVTEKGNPNAASDGAAAGQLLFAATRAALANVEINVAGMKDHDRIAQTRTETDALGRRSQELRGATNQAFRRHLMT